MHTHRFRELIVLTVAVLCVGWSPAGADPKDETQLRTMTCDNGRTVEAIIHHSNTMALHITTTTENFVVVGVERNGEVIVPIRPGFEDEDIVTCETVEFDLTVFGFFTPRS